MKFTSGMFFMEMFWASWTPWMSTWNVRPVCQTGNFWLQKRHRNDFQNKQFKKIKANNWNQKNPTWCRQNWKKTESSADVSRFPKTSPSDLRKVSIDLFLTSFSEILESGERKKGWIYLVAFYRVFPYFDHHKSCACMETAICSPSFRVRTFSCGPWQTFKRAALLQLPILYGSRWFQASWKYSILKIRNLLFQLAFHIPNKSLETPLALPWVHWDEHPVVLSNLVPQPGASMNAPCFPQRC